MFMLNKERDINKAAEIDSKIFWRIVNSRKRIACDTCMCNLHAELSFLALTCWFPSNHCAEVDACAGINFNNKI
ncbi:hypothetical protein DPMN_123930 [Dreissena polymorpha]|uniref:Uncharacterized protein n=1 Tax=Dreissena polymorpha TaxID=45954 RepID=A0A9D4GRU4_DREPO|nr:hypothetical protein DPMN_123930 [Dreissena polymorpha]